ncbi:MAG: hypothetical protein J6S63_08085, partial [Atopobiaceae bacterium]|nr:hypothetical protein [Atopobiaceae bacterium]
MRSWNWRIDDLDYDYHAMMASLEGFCARQFLGRRITNGCMLVMEELVAQVFVPVAQAHGLQDPRLNITISVAEGGEKASLKVDCRAYVEVGIYTEEATKYPSEYSASLVRSMTSDRV